MNFDREIDFLHQQENLKTLQIARSDLEDGTQAAGDSDEEIAITKTLILSYETIKYYENPLHRAASVPRSG